MFESFVCVMPYRPGFSLYIDRGLNFYFMIMIIY